MPIRREHSWRVCAQVPSVVHISNSITLYVRACSYIRIAKRLLPSTMPNGQRDGASASRVDASRTRAATYSNICSDARADGLMARARSSMPSIACVVSSSRHGWLQRREAPRMRQCAPSSCASRPVPAPPGAPTRYCQRRAHQPHGARPPSTRAAAA